MGWGWRHYLLLLAFNGVLIGLAMGLHYGHLHHSSTEEPAASEASSEAAPWPDDIREGFIESCAAQTPASLEQCTCTFEWWEQKVSLSGYLDISNAMIAGRPLSGEQAQMLAKSGLHCAR